MLIEGMDVDTMRRAIQIYLDIAWGSTAARPKAPVDFAACAGPEDVLRSFTKDHRAGTMRRYALRLGNVRYPFMKLVFQELIVRNRFFFAVDTHDDLEFKDHFPDYEQWLELKRFNSRLREAIERAWQESGVPTFAEVVAQVERETPPGPACRDTSPLVLIVDDAEDIALGVNAILSRHGYRTRIARSAEKALEAVHEERPALILSDLEMGGMSGLDLATRLREDPETSRIPFILATAASIGSTNFRVIDGFLVKPYDGELLLRFLSRHLPRPGAEEPGSGPPAKDQP